MFWKKFFAKSISVLLLPISFIYATLQSLRRALYQRGLLKSHKLPGKVISVGNVTLGGTGKTPISIAVCRHLLVKGKSPAILTRGYKSGLETGKGVVFLGGDIIFANGPDIKVFADEARMQSIKLPDVPVIVCNKRYEFAKQFIATEIGQSIDCWILDDGFQHIQIYRDFDLLLGDADLKWCSDFVIPSGLLRERVATLNESDFLLLTRAKESDSNEDLKKRINKKTPVKVEVGISELKVKNPVSVREPCRPFDKSPATLISGIAKPDQFHAEVEKLGIKIESHYAVGDHKCFDPSTLSILNENSSWIITTEKDYYRDPISLKNLESKLYVLPIEMTLPDSLVEKLNLLMKV